MRMAVSLALLSLFALATNVPQRLAAQCSGGSCSRGGCSNGNCGVVQGASGCANGQCSFRRTAPQLPNKVTPAARLSTSNAVASAADTPLNLSKELDLNSQLSQVPDRLVQLSQQQASQGTGLRVTAPQVQQQQQRQSSCGSGGCGFKSGGCSSGSCGGGGKKGLLGRRR